MRTLLITSAAYSGSELEAEFGRLPPALLPLGNRRLFVHQHAALRDSADRILLSLPEEMELDAMDRAALADRGIEVVPVPAGLSLGQSVVYVLNVSGAANDRLRILHGDTLLDGLDLGAEDAVSVGPATEGYSWGYVTRSGDTVLALSDAPPSRGPRPEVLTGFFAIASPVLLIQQVTRRGGDFLGGLAEYAQRRPLRALHSTRWLDFGHLNTYHRSRRQVTTEREFNRLASGRRRVEKSGSKPVKIEAEARWFAGLPEEMRIHAPAYLGMRREGDAVSYAIEYLHMPTLADLFVFGRLPPGAWGRIFDACDEFLSACAAHPAPPEAAEGVADIYGPKTLARLEEFARARGLDLDAPCRLNGTALPSLRAMAEVAAARVPALQPRHLSLVHGDFCFSNILYDTRAELVRVIDPRGLDGAGRFSVHGDLRYDLGKLLHSVVGRYDHIMAGAARLRRDGPLDMQLELPESALLEAVERDFLGRSFAGMAVEGESIGAIGVLLFLSMLPLHADDPRRQETLLANAMRLFLRLERRRRPRPAA